MRIEWLNEDRTRARLTRGWLWWKRVADIHRTDGPYPVWMYAISGGEVQYPIREWITARRDWQTIEQLPPARLVNNNALVAGRTVRK